MLETGICRGLMLIREEFLPFENLRAVSLSNR